MASIASGIYKHKKLFVSNNVRPTRKHLRLSLINFLADFIKDASVLDLFAGTGALGIEALSHGARKVVFVDIASKVVEALKENIRGLDLKENAVVYQSDAIEFIMSGIRKHLKFDIIFIDPPFTKLRAMRNDEYQSYMLELTDRAKALLNPRSILIVKFPKKMPFTYPSGLVEAESRYYGLNRVAFLAQKEYIIEEEETANDTGDKI